MAGYFAILLVLLTLLTGLIWLVDALLLAPKRREKLALALQGHAGNLAQPVAEEMLKEPAFVETAKSVFPIIALITLFRSFIYEPFQIPSGSMMPTLLVGDFILVEKFSYDVKDPVWRKTLYRNKSPKHGDIAVFKYPLDPRVDYIKRIIGLPGDRIVYRDKQIYIAKACQPEQRSNCGVLERIPQQFQAANEFFQNYSPQHRYTETLTAKGYDILQTPTSIENYRAYFQQAGTAIDEFIVPEGQYFALGDNRDNSVDSRFFGFIDEQYLVGRAVFIWMSFEFSDNPERFFLIRWVPVGVRFERLGRIL
ncbi:signal peptidase I [Arsukibacterium sp.]|uniref:signal peptidase I n=1 Tax=Arsukibacterium sp. TaxID=1977258 RepID=UPI002FD9CF98